MMKTNHKIIFDNSINMRKLEDNSIALIVSSPPYPMIAIWDELFKSIDPLINTYLENYDGTKAFQAMHKELDKVWKNLYDKLIPGGLICINIGDATRTFNKNFQLFSNHTRIIQSFLEIGFQLLPEIIWRKQTNSPNKFMGSGMLPPNAYVTLEHEYILIARKGLKREFTNDEKDVRKNSAYFWEERNVWFSDLWDIKGVDQKLSNNVSRERSAAFPLELAYRLINMFSVKGDRILDPFIGTGTTTLAAILTERNSIGFEIDSSLKEIIYSKIANFKDIGNNLISDRILNHKKFITKRIENEKEIKHSNRFLNQPVVTSQEKTISFRKIKSINRNKDNFEVVYE